MFSGIVTARGEVALIDEGRIGVSSGTFSGDALQLGGSVAINGVCLTVATVDDQGFIADVMPETFRRTTLGGLSLKDRVNLEPAMRLGDAIGGHLVTGHVDAVGTVAADRDDGNARWVTIEVPERLAPLLAEKGSVAVDGISLTVVDAGNASFTVSLIPHTLKVTSAGGWHAGSRVNVEVDLMARYVMRALEARHGAAEPLGV
ncbi:MAG: riboflavin synthase [Candidatus Dormibacteria bacterium]